MWRFKYLSGALQCYLGLAIISHGEFRPSGSKHFFSGAVSLSLIIYNFIRKGLRLLSASNHYSLVLFTACSYIINAGRWHVKRMASAAKWMRL